MTLTLDKTDHEDTYTFDECFQCLEQTLSSYPLLTKPERERCVEAVGELKGVFDRFHIKPRP